MDGGTPTDFQTSGLAGAFSDHSINVSLAPSPLSARLARRAVTDALQEWGDEEVADTVALLTSELVTNVVLHARTPARLVVSRAGRRVRVDVVDQSPLTPEVRHPSPEALAGRGMVLVDTLARRWGVEQVGPGKRVWFEVER